MINYNPVTKESGECIVVGRAATAIFLVLSELKQKDKYVLVPANICYAAVFPILSAGLKPLFCDVDQYSGNVTEQSVKKALNDKVVAAVIPHMYGNPVMDLKNIYSMLKDNDILLIEDCASLMTGIKTDLTPGTIGDYVIYSTGYSKTIDLGFGGLLYSRKLPLQNIEAHLNQLPVFDEKYEKETALFSKIYRILRNQRHDSGLACGFYKCLHHSFKDNFIYRIDDSKQTQILESIGTLDSVVALRKEKCAYYTEKLKEKYSLYKYNTNAVPWRFNIYVDHKDEFVRYCLTHSLPVSDWYPCVTPIFGEKEIFNGALWHEQHIINFPLLISNEEIDNICSLLMSYQGEYA